MSDNLKTWPETIKLMAVDENGNYLIDDIPYKDVNRDIQTGTPTELRYL